jgi:hypothetical protein
VARGARGAWRGGAAQARASLSTMMRFTSASTAGET